MEPLNLGGDLQANMAIGRHTTRKGPDREATHERQAARCCGEVLRARLLCPANSETGACRVPRSGCGSVIRDADRSELPKGELQGKEVLSVLTILSCPSTRRGMSLSELLL